MPEVHRFFLFFFSREGKMGFCPGDVQGTLFGLALKI